MDEPLYTRPPSRTGSEFPRFVVLGAVNTAVGFLLFEMLRRVVPYLVAYTFVYGVGIVLSYVLNARYVFDRALSARAALRYPLVYVAQYGVGAVVIHLLVERFGVHATVAFGLAIAVTVPMTFVLARRVIGSAPGGPRGANDHG